MSRTIYKPGGWQAAVYSVSAGAIAIGLVVSVVRVLAAGAGSRSDRDWLAEVPVASIFIALSVFVVWTVVRMWSSRLTLSAESLEARQLFSRKVIDRHDVVAVEVLRSAGFTPSASVLVELTSGGAERLQIPGRYITNKGATELAKAIQDWASGDGPSP